MRRLARSLGKPDSLSSPGDDGDDPYDDGDDELLIENRDQVSPQVGV